MKKQKMVLWTCEKWSGKKCNTEYPCQLMLPKNTRIEDDWCTMQIGKAMWKRVPVSKLTV